MGKTPETELRENRALVKKIMTLSGLSMSVLGLIGFLFLDAVTEFFGDSFTAKALLGSMCLIGITEIVTIKILFRDTDRR